MTTPNPSPREGEKVDLQALEADLILLKESDSPECNLSPEDVLALISELRAAREDGHPCKPILTRHDDGSITMEWPDESSQCALVSKELVKQIVADLNELRALREVVAKLPKTVDGVTIVPKMEVFTESSEIRVTDAAIIGTDQYGSPAVAKTIRCYSTREAAVAAALAERGEGGDE